MTNRKSPLQYEEVSITELELILSHSGFTHEATTNARYGVVLTKDFLADPQFAATAIIRNGETIRFWGKAIAPVKEPAEATVVASDKEAPHAIDDRETKLIPVFKPPSPALDANGDEPPTHGPPADHPRDPEPTQRVNPIPPRPVPDLPIPVSVTVATNVDVPLSDAEVEKALGSMKAAGNGTFPDLNRGAEEDPLIGQLRETKAVSGELVTAFGELTEALANLVSHGDALEGGGTDDHCASADSASSNLQDGAPNADAVDDPPESETNLPIPLSKPPSKPSPPNTAERRSSKPPPLPPTPNGGTVTEEELIFDESHLLTP